MNTRVHFRKIGGRISANALGSILLCVWLCVGLLGAADAQETTSITIQLPLPRLGHTFSLRQWNPSQNAYEAISLSNFTITHQQDDGNGGLMPSSASFIEAQSTISLFNDYYLFDESTGETGPPNLFGTPTFVRTSFLNTPWFSSGEATTSFFIALPESRDGHAFSLYTQGVSYSLSTGPILGYANADGSLGSYGFFEGWISTGPSGPYFIVDHSAGEQSNPRAPTNRNFISDTTWSALSGALPTRLLTIWLPDAEAYNTFELHTPAGSLSWLSPSNSYGYDSNGNWHSGWQISAVIGVNQSFTLTRTVDGASNSGSIGIEDLSLDWTTVFQPYVPSPPPPYEPNWQTMTVNVGENHWGETIYFYGSDSSTIYPTVDWSNQGFQAAYDGNGNEYYRYSYVAYTATIDANLNFYAWSSGGYNNLMDGFNPPYLPNNQRVSVQVGENHWGESIFVQLANGTWVQMQPDWSTQGCQTAVDAWNNTYYTYSYVSYFVDVDVNQNYSIVDSGGHTAFMDGFNPPQPPNYQTVTIQVGENHWSETIWFTLGNGGPTVYASPDWSRMGYQSATDSTGTEYYRYNYVEFTASFDVTHGYSVSATGGHTNFLDGFNPPPLSPTTIQVGENHWAQTITFRFSDGSAATGYPDWSTQGAQIAADGDGNEYYRYNWVNFVTYYAGSASLSSVTDDQGNANLMDGFNPPPPPVQPLPVFLTLPASRWNHSLEVRTSSGRTFPVTPEQMQGFWSTDPNGQSWWNSYYFFNAQSLTVRDENWWVFDATTFDVSPVNTNDLIQWQPADASVDSDGDGLFDWYEGLIGTNGGLWDSDGDGYSDGWEIQHGFNPLDYYDTGADSDGDGIINGQEVVNGTNPNSWDSDGDGVGDAQDIAPWDASVAGSFAMRVPVELIGHAYMAHVEGTNANGSWQSWSGPLVLESVEPGYTVRYSSSIPGFSFANYWVEDATFGASAWAQWGGGSVTLDNPGWYRPSEAPNRFFAIPSGRLGHAFVLWQDGGSSIPVTFGAEIEGQGLFTSWASTYGSSQSWRLLDLTTWEQAPVNTGNTVATEWQPLDVVTGTRSVTILLPNHASGYIFTLHDSQGAVQNLIPSTVWIFDPVSQETVACQAISGAVGVGATYWIVRAVDGAISPSDKMLLENRENDWRSAFGPVRNLTNVTFQVGQERLGHAFSIRHADGFTTNFYAAANYDSWIDTWNADGTPSRYYFTSATAQIDTLQSAQLWDDTVGEAVPSNVNLMNVPPWSPTSILISAARTGHNFILRHENGSTSPVTRAPGYEDPEATLSFWVTVFAGSPSERTFELKYFPAVSVFNPLQTSILVDQSTNEELQFTAGATILDASRWYPQASVLNLNFSTTRWGHELWLQQANGDSWQIQPNALQGSWSVGQNGFSYFSSYGYFDASTSAHPELDWWIFDATTGEISQLNTQNLIGWTATAVDSDSDGLPDWYELLLGLNPNDQDSDHDEVADQWELQHGFNPVSDADGNLARASFQSWITPRPFVVKLPVGRCQHLISLKARSSETSQMSTLGYAGARILGDTFEIEFMVSQAEWSEVHEWQIVDDSTGESTSGANDAQAASWVGAGPTKQFFAIPMSRMGHQFSVAFEGGMVSAQAEEGDGGAEIVGHRILGVIWATVDTSKPFALVDLTTHERAPLSETNLLTATWEADQGQLPVRQVDIWLGSPNERGFVFTVYSQIPGGAVCMTEATAESASIDDVLFLVDDTGNSVELQGPLQPRLVVQVPEGANIWVMRKYDFQTSAPRNISSIPQINGVLSHYVSISQPEVRYFREQTLKVYPEYAAWGAMIHTYGPNGLIFKAYAEPKPVDPLYPDPGVVTLWNDLGYSQTYNVAVITGQWLLGPSMYGTENYFSFQVGGAPVPLGAEWVLPPNLHHSPPEFSNSRLGINFQPYWRLVKPQFNYNGKYANGVSWSMALHKYYYENAPIDMLSGLVKLDVANPRPYENAPFTMSTPDGRNSVELHPGLNDLSNWKPSTFPINLSISSSRWSHQLVVRLENGDEFPVNQGNLQGDLSLPPIANPLTGLWWSSYYYFGATSYLREYLKWSVVDKTTNEAIRVNQPAALNKTDYDFINWICAIPPRNLRATRISGITVELAWEPGSLAVDAGYIVERQMYTSDSVSAWAVVANPSADTRQFVDSTPLGARALAYRIKSRFATAISSPSNAIYLSRLVFPNLGSGGGTAQDIGPNEDTTGGTLDTDEDGISDAEEVANGTNPLKTDTDGDGTPDSVDAYPKDKEASELLSLRKYVSIDLSSIIKKDKHFQNVGVGGVGIDDDNSVGLFWSSADEALFGGYPPVHVATFSNGVMQYHWKYNYVRSLDSTRWIEANPFAALGSGIAAINPVYSELAPEGAIEQVRFALNSEVVGSNGPLPSFVDPRTVETITSTSTVWFTDGGMNVVEKYSLFNGGAGSSHLNWVINGMEYPYFNVETNHQERPTFLPSSAGGNSVYGTLLPIGASSAYFAKISTDAPTPVFISAKAPIVLSSWGDWIFGFPAYGENAPAPSTEIAAGTIAPVWIEGTTIKNFYDLLPTRHRLQILFTDSQRYWHPYAQINSNGDVLFEAIVFDPTVTERWRNAKLLLQRSQTIEESRVFEVDIPDSAALSKDGRAFNRNGAIVRGQELLLPVEMMVDANRDGEMSFTEAATHDKDGTTAEKPYRFWVNNDHDEGHTVDGSDWEQDDTNGSADSADENIHWRRDLEDFSRLWVTFKGLGEMLKQSGIEVKFEMKPMEGESSTTAAIRIFPAYEKQDGGNKYLSEDSIAWEQVDREGGTVEPFFGKAFGKAGQGQSCPLPTTDIYPTWTMPSDSSPYRYFIFEGVGPGKGRLVLTIYKDGQKIGEYPPVYFELTDVKDLYERYTVGDNNGGAPAHNAAILKTYDQPSGYIRAGHARPFSYSNSDPEEKKYILYVHGWNMTPGEKDKFAETAFKRLFWQGYKGRFGAFQWPTTYGFGEAFGFTDSNPVSSFIASGADASGDQTNYDRGEWSAWRSAPMLRGLLAQLNQKYPGQVHVLAHSMGNVVTGEALRLQSLQGGGQLIKTYVASQAALPVHCYAPEHPDDIKGRRGGLEYFSATLQTPNIYKSWLASNAAVAGKRVNFYNVNDYALWEDVWQLNQHFKPDQRDLPEQPWWYAFEGDKTISPPEDKFQKTNGPAILGGTATALRLGTPTAVEDRYEIMAFAAESWSKALGGIAGKGGLSSFVNLHDLWPGDPDGGQRPYHSHKWHSAQFRSTNMVQKEYWKTLVGRDAFNVVQP